MGITIGIDLGTTNSATCIKKIYLSPIRNAEGDELTPSCVTAIPQADDTSFDYVVGRASRDLLKQYPEHTITSVKRLIGRDFDDTEVENMINHDLVSYCITTDPSEPGSIRIPLAGSLQTPEMISGIILKKLIADGEKELQGKIDQVVVTVPAYFSDRQKFATRAACDYAGVKLLRLLPEPTAAALSFGLGELPPDESRTMMVFDLGGGTFDISVLSFAGGSFMEITKGGDMWLGGDNIDQLLVDHIFSCAQKTADCKPIPELINLLSPAEKARFIVEIKEKAEAAKIELSSAPSATVDLYGLLKDEENKLIDIDVTITREEFATLLNPVVRRISDMARQILQEIRFEPELIDTVLMVGGSSLVPAIQEELKNLFGAEKVMQHPRPMLAIAEGAALMAAQMTSQENSKEDQFFSMMHSTAHDYYLQLAGGKKHLLVARNTPLPVTVEEKLSFTTARQFLARLRVLNEVDGVLDAVGELWFHDDAEATEKEDDPTQLMLRFSVDEDNIITMKASSLTNESHFIEAHIARGSLAAKLYGDLERTLSSIVAQKSSGSIEKDTQKLSRQIVATILTASDPLTGETRVEQKLKAQRQINTLKFFPEKAIAPLTDYDLLLKAKNLCTDVIRPEKMQHLDTLLEKFKQALESLEDISVFERIAEELDEFYDAFPIANDLVDAENAAIVLDKCAPSEAKKVRNQINILKQLHVQGDTDLAEQALDTLFELIHTNLTSVPQPRGHFDREVSL